MGDNVEKRIIHLSSTDSTNAYLKDLARAGAKEGTVVFADRQTAGRGRLGRSFYSLDGGLYMSILLRPENGVFDALVITAAAAVAVSRAIESLCDKKCLIKWVNDIYIDRKKVCGILAEGALFPDGKLDFAVLGIGININDPKGGFPDEIKDIATSLFGCGKTPENFKENLLNAVFDEFLKLYENLSDRAFMNFYRERSFVIGKDIYYIKNGEKHFATAVDIDDSGRLLAEDENGIKTIDSGEVTVRINEDE